MRALPAAFLLLCSSAAAAGFPLEDARWAAADADLLRLLTQSPGECLAPVAEDDAYKVNVGRVAFRSPFLFGGTASRVGLSCNACHRDGHDNPDFFLAGVSGEPGTADVTSSVFSRTREDGAFNPVPIPSLVGIAGKASFGERAPHGSLQAFVASAVTEEFDGEAAPFLVEAIAAYLTHLDPKYCPPRGRAATAGDDLATSRAALDAAEEALRRGDAKTGDFLLLAARGLLKRIDGRFAELDAERAAIGALSASIGAQRTLAARDPAAALQAGPALRAQFEETAARLLAAQSKSLYDRDTLKRRLGAEKSGHD